MAKNKGHRRDIPVLDEAIPEEIKEEVVEVIAEPVIEAVTDPEFKFPAHTIKQAGTVIPTTLNIRKRPSMEAEILKVVWKNEDVEILDESTTNGWLPVLLADGTKGYCMQKFIKVIN